MSNEIQVRASLTVRNGNQQFISNPQSCQDDQTGIGRECITVQASLSGTDVTFTLTDPGWYAIACIGTEADYVEYGIWDPQLAVFHPWGEVSPGDVSVGKFSRNFGEEYAATGTGTMTIKNNLRVKAYGAACKVQIDAVER